METDGALAERVYFRSCLLFGRFLRSARYSRVDVGSDAVRKRRTFLAPLLISLGLPLVKLLDTGMRVVSQKAWEQREATMYDVLHSTAVHIGKGELLLPLLRGRTLASLLEDPAIAESSRDLAVELSANSLADFHRLGLTHGDAMAENVIVDLDARVARWFDFETIHEPDRPMTWRRADDLRALVSTCLVRTPIGRYPRTLRGIIDSYGSEEIAREVADTFTSVVKRPLAFHLGQAPLSYRSYGVIARLLRERITV